MYFWDMGAYISTENFSAQNLYNFFKKMGPMIQELQWEKVYVPDFWYKLLPPDYFLPENWDYNTRLLFQDVFIPPCYRIVYDSVAKEY